MGDKPPRSPTPCPPAAKPPHILEDDMIWNCLMSASLDAIVVTGPDDLIEQANDAAASLLGGSGDVLGLNYFALLPDALRDPQRGQVRAALAGPVAQHWPLELGGRHLTCIVYPLGKAGAIIMHRDITAQAQAEESAQNKRARLQTLIETLPDLIWLKDLEGRYVNCNQKFERLAGATENQIKGRTDQELLPAELAAAMMRGAQTALQENRSVRERQWVVFARGGQRELVEIVHTPFIDSLGVCKGVMGIARDITAFHDSAEQLRRHRDTLELEVQARTAELQNALSHLRDTQEKLVQSEKLAGLASVVAGVAHELNTPIGNCLTVATTLEDQANALMEQLEGNSVRRSDLRQYAQTAQSGARLLHSGLLRASGLIDKFKLIAAGPDSATRLPFLLDDTVHYVAAIMAPRLEGKPYRIELAVPSGIAMESYPAALEQVLANLFENSLVHGLARRPQGTMRLSASVNGPLVMLEYTDDGVGMPEEVRRNVFTPFFTTRFGQGGSGLGMSISYNLVTGLLGGAIEVSSAPECGCTYRIALPLQAPPA